MQFLSIKHEYTHMSKKIKICFVWIFKILNMCNIIHINHNMKFMWLLFELMKIEFHMKFVLTYEA
jgi:hypothetical protein